MAKINQIIKHQHMGNSTTSTTTKATAASTERSSPTTTKPTVKSTEISSTTTNKPDTPECGPLTLPEEPTGIINIAT